MISENIKKIRASNNLNMRQFADLIGIDFSEISRWEKGISEPRIKYRNKICEVFKITPAQLWE